MSPTLSYNTDAPCNKVAAVTVSFWVLKILATTLGETAGDLLAITWQLGYVTGLAITLVFFASALAVQLSASRFHALIFWTVIVGTTMLGTEISDLMDRTLQLGYPVGAALLATALAVTLILWARCEGRIRVYPVESRRVELFYWAAIVFSNSLGTAFGDLLSDSLGLGYVSGALLTAAVIGLVLILHYATRLAPALMFWIAFVFTRPFGATFGDMLTKPVAQGGLNFGTAEASAIALSLMGLVIALAYRGGRRR